jgi:phenylalanyl-tRNA synthetase beta chain
MERFRRSSPAQVDLGEGTTSCCHIVRDQGLHKASVNASSLLRGARCGGPRIKVQPRRTHRSSADLSTENIAFSFVTTGAATFRVSVDPILCYLNVPMPTVTIVRDRLLEALGSKVSDTDLAELCFSYGLELEALSEEPLSDLLGGQRSRSGWSDAVEELESHTGLPDQRVCCVKLEVPANRPDLLCFEGLVQALRVFLGMDPPSAYRLRRTEPREQVFVKRNTLRPYLVAAVLRDIDLKDPFRYQSLMELQEHLHQNLGRRRALVAIGTHDLDSVHGPFTYTLKEPTQIRFRPLAADCEMDGPELVQNYAHDRHLKRYLPLIENAPAYPVIYDQDGCVLSLPPIINGDRSKIRPSTRNMLIECTGTDLVKLTIALNTMVTIFSRYCNLAFDVEPVLIHYEEALPEDRLVTISEHVLDARTLCTPWLESRSMVIPTDYIQSLLGVSLSTAELEHHLQRMQLQVESPSRDASGDRTVCVRVPVFRSDILHACDVAEDVGVSFGFDRIPEQTASCVPSGRWQTLERLTDHLRRELAQQGYTEVLTWVTVSHAENSEMLQRNVAEWPAVRLSNPKTLEFEECRTSLLVGLLKTLREHRKAALPLRLFETGDILLLDSRTETGARNERHLAAVYSDVRAGFEIVKHLLDRLMLSLNLTALGYREGYRLDPNECRDDLFFPGRRASIVVERPPGACLVLGSMGWVHPRVLKSFGLTAPVSALELNVQPFGE